MLDLVDILNIKDDVRLLFTTIILEVPPDIPASGIKCNRLNL